MLRAAQSARRRGDGELRHLQSKNPHSAQSAEGRLTPLRAELLPPVSTGRKVSPANRHIDLPRRLSLRRQAGRRQPLTDETFERLASMVAVTIENHRRMRREKNDGTT
jgi:hypothetical protein